MDPSEVFERAQIMEDPGDLYPGESGEEKWIATDPETDCQGVSWFEAAARVNLVYAVKEYEADEGSTVPYMSSGPDQVFKMTWLDEDQKSLSGSLRDRLPF